MVGRLSSAAVFFSFFFFYYFWFQRPQEQLNLVIKYGAEDLFREELEEEEEEQQAGDKPAAEPEKVHISRPGSDFVFPNFANAIERKKESRISRLEFISDFWRGMNTCSLSKKF